MPQWVDRLGKGESTISLLYLVAGGGSLGHIGQFRNICACYTPSTLGRDKQRRTLSGEQILSPKSKRYVRMGRKQWGQRTELPVVLPPPRLPSSPSILAYENVH